MKRGNRNGAKKEKWIMALSSVFVLAALTATGLFFRGNHEEKNDEGEKPQSITSIIKISLTVLVIGYALGKIAMLFS